MRLYVALSGALFAVPVLAQETSPPPQAANTGFDTSRIVLRGGVHFDVGGAINLGGSSTGARAAVGVNGGVGYLIFPRFEVDLDARFTLRVAPAPIEVELLDVTPGARWRPIDQFQLRAGIPIPLVPQAGVGILAGVAYVQPMGSHLSLVAGADYTYYFTDYWRQVAPQGRIEFHAGVQARL
jgi:hypothetical protein